MRAFSITGWSGSGKTTLIARLIKHFKQENKKVIAVKNVPQKYYLEPESTDTFRFMDAGADEVCLVSKKQFLTMERLETSDEVFEVLQSRYADCHLLLLEGLRKDGIPVIEVFNSMKNETLKNPLDTLIAVVSDIPVATATIPNFCRDDIRRIIHFMEAYYE